MTSGPYQSSLVRFAIAQYRQGLARHRVAMRTAYSTAVMGAAVTLLPVYAVVNASMNASKWVGRSLKRSWQQGELPEMTAKAAKLLNFTDFEESCLIVPTSEALKIPDNSAESMMVQTLLSVGSCLSLAQVELLSIGCDSAGRFPWRISRVFNKLRWVGKGDEIAVSDQITGIASDLETRSIVLVKNHTAVWNGLSATQQAKLQSKIAGLLAGESAVYVRSLFSEPGLTFGQKPSLVSSFRSFWLEVLSVMAWLYRDYSPKVFHRSEEAVRLSAASPPRLPLGGEKAAEISLAISNAGAIQTRDPGSAFQTNIAATNIAATNLAVLERVAVSKRLASDQTSGEAAYLGGADYWETQVIAFDYIEHPLETLLKWVDRICLWMEDRWQAFKGWLLRLRT
jgi:hypothetical protein